LYQDLGVNFTDPRSKTTLSGQKVYAAFFAGAPAGFDGKRKFTSHLS